MFTDSTLKAIFAKTSGHCHFCGDRLVFKRYGWKGKTALAGAWEADHVVQRGKGGRKSADNCLPACVRCNRLRWHRTGKDLREVIFLGLIALDQVKKRSEAGEELIRLKAKRLKSNQGRRRGI